MDRSREVRYLRRVDALVASGQTDEALACLRRLVLRRPDSVEGYLRIAAVLRQSRRSREAMRLLREVISRSPRLVAPREALAEICLESGCWEEAIAESRVLLDLCPQSLFARDVLSAAYLQRGQLDAALRVTDEMIRLDPLDAANHFKKGVLLQQKGCVGEAVGAFARVLEMEDESEVADESRAALEMLDSSQIQQILMLAVEDVPFRTRLTQDVRQALDQRGYSLSEAGLQMLGQVQFDDLPLPPPGWRQYRYH